MARILIIIVTLHNLFGQAAFSTLALAPSFVSTYNSRTGIIPTWGTRRHDVTTSRVTNHVSFNGLSTFHQLRRRSQLWDDSSPERIMCPRRKRYFPILGMTSSESSSGDDAIPFVKAEDGEALQALFAKQCDDDGLMTKDTLKAVPEIAQILADEELLLDELDDIWNAAPKFPDVDASVKSKEERIDVDSFIQIYRDIDDLFEDDEEKEEKEVSAKGASTKVDEKAKEVKSENNLGKDAENEDEDDQGMATDEKELEVAFKTICDKAGLVSKQALRNWDEIQQLINDDMLNEKEFEALWERTAKSPGAADQLDIDGFLSFNVALDDLFDFEDDDEDTDVDKVDDERSDPGETTPTKNKPLVVGDDLPSGVIFSQLADNDFLVGMEELKCWGELQEMLDEGELLPLELQNIFSEVPKAPGTKDKLNEDGFLALYDAIDALFEDQEEEENESDTATEVLPTEKAEDATSSPARSSAKDRLFTLLSRLEETDEDSIPCGLEFDEKEQAQVLAVVTALEAEPSNKILSMGTTIEPMDLSGTWDLLYTSSSMMKFNKGLSGLGGSFPNGKFGGLKQKLQASRYMADVEYSERIDVNPESNSFDVTITGDWKLKSSVSLYTGSPTIVMSVEPDKVMYGPTSTRADHWKSVRSMNLLDITYLDDDLRIMRGNTSTDTLFIFRKSK